MGTLVGGIWSDDVDGGAFLSAFPHALSRRGLTLTDPGRLKMASPDYAGLAARLRDAQAPMVTGVLPPPVALAFLAAAQRVGYQPRMVSFAKAFAFPETVAQIGRDDLVLTNEVWWSPAWPFRSGLTGESSAEVAQAYEKSTGRQWIQTLGFSHAMVDAAVQTIQRSTSPTREGLRAGLSGLRARTLVGVLAFMGRYPAYNVCSTPAVGGQWVKANDRWVLQVVDNTRSPFIPVTAELTVRRSKS